MARILVVDDEEAIRDLIKEVLMPHGHEFTLCGSGREAMEQLRKAPYELAIVDRNMPGMSGIELVQLVRQNPKLAKLKVLMCTGASVTREIDEAFEAGADDYVLKPLNFSQLLAKVAKALGGAPRAG